MVAEFTCVVLPVLALMGLSAMAMKMGPLTTSLLLMVRPMLSLAVIMRVTAGSAPRLAFPWHGP